MAPEVINKRPHSFGSDFWSIGVFLFELLSCKSPFRRNTVRLLRFSWTEYALEWGKINIALLSGRGNIRNDEPRNSRCRVPQSDQPQCGWAHSSSLSSRYESRSTSLVSTPFSDPERRLGAREGIEEVREVDLLRNFDFCKLRHGLMDSPIKVKYFILFWFILLCHFQPNISGPSDTSQFDDFAADNSGPPDETSGWDNDF